MAIKNGAFGLLLMLKEQLIANRPSFIPWTFGIGSILNSGRETGPQNKGDMKKQKRFDIKAGISLISDLWFDSIKMFRIVIIPTFFIWNQQAVTDKCFSFGFVWLRWMVWVDIWDNRKSE